MPFDSSILFFLSLVVDFGLVLVILILKVVVFGLFFI
jgi:hypothetical protein